MTIKELSQLYYLNREIQQEQQKLAELRAAATNTTARISGLPGVGSISDKTAIAATIQPPESLHSQYTGQSYAADYQSAICGWPNMVSGIPKSWG